MFSSSSPWPFLNQSLDWESSSSSCWEPSSLSSLLSSSWLVGSVVEAAGLPNPVMPPKLKPPVVGAVVVVDGAVEPKEKVEVAGVADVVAVVEEAGAPNENVEGVDEGAVVVGAPNEKVDFEESVVVVVGAEVVVGAPKENPVVGLDSAGLVVVVLEVVVGPNENPVVGFDSAGFDSVDGLVVGC